MRNLQVSIRAKQGHLSQIASQKCTLSTCLLLWVELASAERHSWMISGSFAELGTKRKRLVLGQVSILRIWMRAIPLALLDVFEFSNQLRSARALYGELNNIFTWSMLYLNWVTIWNRHPQALSREYGEGWNHRLQQVLPIVCYWCIGRGYEAVCFGSQRKASDKVSSSCTSSSHSVLTEHYKF